MLFWLAEILLLVPVAVLYWYMQASAVRMLPQADYELLQRRTRTYSLAKGVALLSLLALLFLLTQYLPQYQLLLLQGSVLLLLLAAFGLPTWLSYKVHNLGLSKDFCMRYVWAEVLLYALLAAWLSLPLLQYKYPVGEEVEEEAKADVYLPML